MEYHTPEYFFRPKPLAPQLESSRLWLRLPAPEDATEVEKQINQSKSLLKPWFAWAQGEVHSDQILQSIHQARREFEQKSHLKYHIFYQKNARFIGSIGLNTISWSEPKGELYFWRCKSQPQKGLMREALECLCHYAFEELHMRRLEIRTPAGNRPSERLALQCGFGLEGIRQDDYRLPDGELVDMKVLVRLK